MLQVADFSILPMSIPAQFPPLLPEGGFLWYKYRAMDDSAPEPPRARGRLFQFAPFPAITNFPLSGSAAEKGAGLPAVDFRQPDAVE